MRCDALQIHVEQLTGGDLPGGDQLGLAGDSGIGEVESVHRIGNLLKGFALRREAG
jgi:hypothetical protein